MQIVGENQKIIYDGFVGYVAAITPRGNGNMQVSCYAVSSVFDRKRIQEMLQLAGSSPEGYKYDVVYCSYIDHILLGDKAAVTSEQGAILIAATVLDSGRYVFYTNITGDQKERSAAFAYIMQHLYVLGVNRPSDAQGKPSSAESDNTPAIPHKPVPAAMKYNGARVLYAHNFLFNLFGDQMLAIVCDSQTEYNNFMDALHELHIITARSMMPSEWNGVSRYIMFDIRRNTAFAVYNLPASVESVMPFQKFMKQIMDDASENLKRNMVHT